MNVGHGQLRDRFGIETGGAHTNAISKRIDPARVGALPVTEESAASVLSLPMYPELTNEEVGRVIEEIMHWAANREALSRQAV